MEGDDSLIIECSDGFVPTTCSLASRLEFFKVMLRLDVKENKEKVCQLKEYNKEQVGSLFDVLGGKRKAKELSVEKLLDVVPLAHYLNAKELLNAAPDKISDVVRNSSCSDVIENFNVYVDLAVQFNSEQLKDVCRKYWVLQRRGRICPKYTVSQKICGACRCCHFCGGNCTFYNGKTCSEDSGLSMVTSSGQFGQPADYLVQGLAKYNISLVEELFPNVRIIQHSYFFEPLLRCCDFGDISNQQLQDILSLDLKKLVDLFKANSSASSETVLRLVERSIIKDDICAKMLGLCLSPGFSYMEAAQKLIEKCGAYADKAFNTECVNPLHLACHWDQGHLVEYIVGKGANVNCLTNDSANFTPLHMAASFNSCKAVEALLKFKPSLNEIGLQGKTPLALAVQWNHTKVVEILVNAKADLNIGDSYKVYPIHAAVVKGNAEMVQFLVKGKANLDVKNGSGETALHIATGRGKIDVVKIIVEGGANLDILNDNGDTALHIAAMKGFIDIVKVLVEGRANLDLQNKSKDTTLHIAFKQSPEIVKLLVKAGANVGVANTSGETALHLAANQGNTDLVKILVEAGANLDLVNINGDTALHIATKKGIFEMVEVLVERRANLDLKNNSKDTALHIAFKTSPEIVKLLVKSGAKLDLLNNAGETALHLAVNQQNSELANLLVKSGASLNLVNNNGDTALLIATKKGILEIVKFLVEAGANRNVSDANKQTACDIAMTASRRDIVDVLLQKPCNLQ